MAAQQTLVRKITIGTPVRRVVGAQAQRLDDLLDVKIQLPQDGNILMFNPDTNTFENIPEVSGGTF